MTTHEQKVNLLKKYYKEIESTDTISTMGLFSISGSLSISRKEKFFIEGDIPPERLDNAIKNFAEDLDLETVLGFYDIAGDGSKGYIFTDNEVYYRYKFYPRILKYDEIEQVEYIDDREPDFSDIFGDIFGKSISQSVSNTDPDGRELRFKLYDGSIIIWNNFSGNLKAMFNFWDELLDLIHTKGIENNSEGNTLTESDTERKDTYLIDDTYPIYVIGASLSGKTTFINALAGKEILPQKYENDCKVDVKIRNINAVENPFLNTLDTDEVTDEDFFVHIFDKEGNYNVYLAKSSNDICGLLKEEGVWDAILEGNIQGVNAERRGIEINELDGENFNKKYVLEDCKEGLLIFLMSAVEIGTTEEGNLLQMVAEVTGKNPNIKVIFAINKMDELDPDKDTSEEIFSELIKIIQNYGFENIDLMPISAQKALLLRKSLNGQELSRRERVDLKRFLLDLNEDYDFEDDTFKLENDNTVEAIDLKGVKYTRDFLNEALVYTGFPALERLINKIVMESEKLSQQKPLESEKTALKQLIQDDFFGPGIDINMSRVFPVIVMATMSSGKSTLINALLGEDIMPNRNVACTAKLFYVLDDDTAVSNKLYITKKDGSVECIEENLNKKLNEANNDDDVMELLLTGQIKGVQNTNRSLLMIDTPGPNNSTDRSHEIVAKQVMSKVEGGLVLYVMNATQMGINDDKELLEFISEQMNKKPEMDIMFVLNKVDELDQERESILKFMLEAKEYLISCGFRNPDIIPVSALAGVLFHKVEKGTALTRKERSNFQNLYDIFSSDKLNLGVYSMVDDIADLEKNINLGTTEVPLIQLESALANTGIPELERKIQSYQITSSMIDPLKINIK